MKMKITILSVLLSIFVAGCSSVGGTNNAAVPNSAPNTNTDAAGTPSSGSAEAQASSPEAVVTDLYKQHDAKKSPFFQTKNRALVDKYFTKTLADLIWKDATSSKNEVGAIDGDPLYNAQDMEIKNFSIGKGDVKGETSMVAATFTNFGNKKTVNFSLKQTAGAWKIDNILYGDGDSLLKWLKDTYSKSTSGNPPSGEFEGKYQVGDTTCTVTPAKMSFEVRWAKGSGVELFFFKEGNTFESSPDKGGPNRFEFDDGNYNSGTFYRADGKSMRVSRAK